MRAVIFAGGDATPRAVVEPWMRSGALVIAADGGARNAMAAGVVPDALVGDLDSLPVGLRSDLEARAVRVQLHPTRKNETDLELAIRYALAEAASDIVIFGALGGSWDHSLGNILLLASPVLGRVPARLVDSHQMMTLVRSRGDIRIAGRSGDVLSLIALGGDARGVTIEGCEYPLDDAVLPFGATLGISNRFISEEARVQVRDGLVLIVHRGQE